MSYQLILAALHLHVEGVLDYYVFVYPIYFQAFFKNIYRMFPNKDLMYTLVCWNHKKYIHENWVQEKQMRFCKYASGIHQ